MEQHLLFLVSRFYTSVSSMLSSSLFFLFLNASFLLSFIPIASSSMESQLLLQVKLQLNDPLSYLESWNENNLPCKFFGVSCDLDTGHVTGISLANLSLSGTLSPCLGVLPHLLTLNLAANDISGVVPLELANCTALQVLNLSANSFTGQLPDLSTLQRLRVLDLSTNSFSGKFPEWVSKLHHLVQLGLGENNFDHGEEIPESIGQLKSLTWLFMAECNLRGEIPASVFGLTSLETLDFSRNQISGQVSRSISNLSNLYKIELYQNNLTGELPSELANLTLLREFDISRNQFFGKLPPGISNLKALTVFQVYSNHFTGEIPQGFGDMQFLHSFSIYENNFSGEFPFNFGHFSPLYLIDISENNFSGRFPSFLCQNNKLKYLLALNNHFSGEFPDSYAQCKTLVRFRISQNGFFGKFPDGLWGLPSAVIIDVADNNFVGSMSSEIGASTSLTQLYVQNNKFSGQLPIELGKLSMLQKLFAFNNSFSHVIPLQIGNLKQLSSLHLEGNALTGLIPPELGMCNNLVDLNLARNSLSGNIPRTLALLVSLNSLDVSEDNLTGSIPVGLQALKLSFIDFSRNHLSGKIPDQLLFIAGSEAFSGNSGLCIDRIPQDQRYTGLSLCNLSSNRTDGSQKIIFLVLFLLLAMTILLAGIAYITYQSFKEQCKKSKLEQVMEKDSEWTLQSFHPIDLDPEEISAVDEQNLIASGGTGTVYRLDLDQNRGSVAVKKLCNSADAKVLTAEIETMAKIKHRNILKLYACLRGKGSNFLVFEYMPNGSLFLALRREIKVGQPELDWHKRYKIALGIAKGVMYLHHDCTPAIIHRDIKSTNILLNIEYEAKIADFGIAKSVDESNLSSFAGTHGYMAPELAYASKATEKSDVYSFGIVLLELLTGRSPIDSQFGGNGILHWVSTHLDDQKLLDMFDTGVSDTAKEDMRKVLKIAMHCTAETPSLRPMMREVVNMLIDANHCNIVPRAKSLVKN